MSQFAFGPVVIEVETPRVDSINGLSGTLTLTVGSGLHITSLVNNINITSDAITALTGDATATGPGSVPLTLATVNSNVGSFGSASDSAFFTVNGKGLITAAGSTSIQIAESQVTNLVSDLAGKQPVGNYITALSSDVVATGPGAVASTIQPNVVSNSKLAQAPACTIKGNNTNATANEADLTVTQGRTLLGIDSGFTAVTSGVTYTTPSNITTATLFKFILIGGGGGGGGNNTANGHSCGGGGGAVGLLSISGLSPSTAYTIAIGAAGAQGANTPTAGGAGGTTTLTIGATTYTAGGGGGGPVTSSTSYGGAGGTATNCTLNLPGQNGAGTEATGTQSTAGRGGDSPLGWGLGGVGWVVFFGNDGFNGTGFGGGGGGTQGAGGFGGGGAPGAIIVEYWN